MKKSETTRRYVAFLIGLLLSAFGAVFVIRAALGTSPIAAIPYSLSLIVPRLTLGNWTIIMNIVLILVQVILLKGKMNVFQVFLQVLTTFLYGYFSDFFMWVLQAYAPSLYIVKLCSLVAGCAIIAFGLYLEITADVTMLPGDAFVRAIAKVSHKEYGTIKTISDVSMTVIAATLCLVFLKKLVGVREGTIIISLITGNIMSFYNARFKRFSNWLVLGAKNDNEKNTDTSSLNSNLSNCN